MASKNQEFGDLEKRWAIVPEGSGICRGCLPTKARERRGQEEGRAKKAAYRNFSARIEKIHHPRMICYRLRLVIENHSLFYCNKLTRSIPMNTVVCRIPDDSIQHSRWPLFFAREVLREVVDSLKTRKGEEDGTSSA
jgi:hypothetical protein